MAKRERPDPSFYDCPQNLWCHMRSDKTVCTCLRDVARLDKPMDLDKVLGKKEMKDG